MSEANEHVPVTFFVGENGSGKSTLLERIAASAELPAMGASRDAALDPTLAHAEKLAAALRLAWAIRSRQGFFLRAEDFFGRLKGLARIDARVRREKAEAPRRRPCGRAPRDGWHPSRRARGGRILARVRQQGPTVRASWTSSPSASSRTTRSIA
jgi:hypothetical protein